MLFSTHEAPPRIRRATNLWRTTDISRAQILHAPIFMARITSLGTTYYLLWMARHILWCVFLQFHKLSKQYPDAEPC